MKKIDKALMARKKNFEDIVARYEEQGYSYTTVTISIIKANIVAVFILLLSALVFGAPFLAVYEGSMTLSMLSSFYMLGAFLLTLVLHEGLHGLGWSFFCKKHLHSIQFGVIWKYLTPYCCCLEPLSWKPYLFGGLLPFMVLGIGFFIVAMLSGSIFWLLLAILNVGGAGGDLMVSYTIIKERPKLLMDLPQDCGYVYFHKD